VCSSVLQCVAVWCHALQCGAAQCVAVCCVGSMWLDSRKALPLEYCVFWIEYSALMLIVCCSVLQCVAVCCNVLQCVADFCSVLQCALWIE